MPNVVTRGLGIFGRVQADSMLIGGAEVPAGFGNSFYVDGDNGVDTNAGNTWKTAFKTIQAAVTAASAGDSVFVRPKAMAAGATDPSDYAETIIIPAGKSGLRLIGVGVGLAQGAQPQIKKGSGSTAHLTIRSPGCLVSGLSFNGGSATGGGILLDDDAATKSAFGTVIRDCFFKNCKGSAAADTGGAIMWSSAGGAWQVRIERCHFYDNRGGIVLLGTGGSRPTDVVIEDCDFGSSANTTVDCDIFLSGGDGAQGVIIRRCSFQTVDVPGYATNPAAARYLDLTDCEGLIENCYFACIVAGTGAKTFKAAGDAAKIPATVRFSGCHGESASDGSTTEIVRAA